MKILCDFLVYQSKHIQVVFCFLTPKYLSSQCLKYYMFNRMYNVFEVIVDVMKGILIKCVPEYLF